MTPFPALGAALMMAAPVQTAGPLVLHVALCDGGNASIPIERDERDRGDCAQACHAVLCGSRKRPRSV